MVTSLQLPQLEGGRVRTNFPTLLLLTGRVGFERETLGVQKPVCFSLGGLVGAVGRIGKMGGLLAQASGAKSATEEQKQTSQRVNASRTRETAEGKKGDGGWEVSGQQVVNRSLCQFQRGE